MAPILAAPLMAGSTKASPATNNATVKPVPAITPATSRSRRRMPRGRPKPMKSDRQPKPKTPRVFPIINEINTSQETVPTLENSTPAFARPNISIPKSTTTFHSCSKRGQRGAVREIFLKESLSLAASVRQKGNDEHQRQGGMQMSPVQADPAHDSADYDVGPVAVDM